MENRSSLFGIIAIIIGASGLGIGAYSVVNFQTVEGPQGPPGDDGTDGQDGQDGQDIVGLQVGILDPNQLEVVSGLVEIRVLLWNSSECSINVYINGSLYATSVPWMWNTTTVSDGWWNVSVRAIDTESNSAHDEVLVYVLNNPAPTPRARVYYQGTEYLVQSTNPIIIDFNQKTYDTTNNFSLGTNRYTVPEDGLYLLVTSVVLHKPSGNCYGYIIFYVNGAKLYYPSDAMCSYFSTVPYFVVSLTETVSLSKGDLIDVRINPSYQGTPISVYIYGAPDWGRTTFSITKLSN